jgi:hypothetical protein
MPGIIFDLILLDTRLDIQLGSALGTERTDVRKEMKIDLEKGFDSLVEMPFVVLYKTADNTISKMPSNFAAFSGRSRYTSRWCG